jgi:hypothetical protein
MDAMNNSRMSISRETLHISLFNILVGLDDKFKIRKFNDENLNISAALKNVRAIGIENIRLFEKCTGH